MQRTNQERPSFPSEEVCEEEHAKEYLGHTSIGRTAYDQASSMPPGMSQDTDYLSYSPSLVEIFQLVEYPQILNYKLISRRIWDVIQRNSRMMCRPMAYLEFLYISETEFIINVTVLQTEMSDCQTGNDIKAIWNVHLKEQRMELINCNNQSIIDHCNKYYTSNADLLVDGHRDRRVFASIMVFDMRGVMDTLRSLLSEIFNRYDFHSIVLRRKERPLAFGNTTLNSIAEMICELGRRSKCTSEIIEASAHCKSLHKLVRSFGAYRLYLYLTTVNLSKVLPPLMDANLFQGPCHLLEMRVQPHTFDSLQPLVDAVMGWACGKWSISIINIIMRRADFRWSDEELLRAFSHIPGFRYPNEKEKNHQEFRISAVIDVNDSVIDGDVENPLIIEYGFPNLLFIFTIDSYSENKYLEVRDPMCRVKYEEFY